MAAVNRCRVNAVSPSGCPSADPGADHGRDPRPDHAADPITRDQRRARTAALILDRGRELFAELGFERTTIRAVAARAGVDPALVMQHYGSKEQLFGACAQWQVDHKKLAQAPREAIPQAVLNDLFAGFEDAEQRDAAVALLRNCLTHPGALGVMRDEVMCEPQQLIAETIGGPDADLRAGLVAAVGIGLALTRFLLEIPAVAQASREDIERVMLPVLAALLDGPPDCANADPPFPDELPAAASG